MNVGILSCLRGAGERLRPAVKEQSLRHPQKEIVMRKLRVLAPLAQVPLFFPKTVRFYLPAFPFKNSKAAAVFNELTSAGISRSMIWTPGPSQHYTATDFARLLYRLPRALLFLFIMLRRAPLLDYIDLQIILGREVYRHLLLRYPLVKPIIISDVSPELHMLWSAATVAGAGALWWQDDYHHIEFLPYSVVAAAVLNQDGYDVVCQSSPAAMIVRRPSLRSKSIRLIPDKPRVGIATSNFFFASSEQLEFLYQIRQVLCVDVLYVRLHPNSTLTLADFPETWVTIAPVDESLEQFASKIDIAVVGNSAVQLKLVSEGVPVVHISGLDPQDYDSYGYCQREFVFGIQLIQDLRLFDLRKFYSEEISYVKLEEYVGIRDSKLVSDLACLAR